MNKKILLELIWWLFTAITTIIVLLPIYLETQNYPFYIANVIYIVAFITMTRYIFLLRHTVLAGQQTLKLILIFLCIPFVFYLVQGLNHFQTFLDEEGMEAMVGTLPSTAGYNMVQYIRNEILLFGVGAVTSGVIFPFRLMMSIWHFRNRGTE